ncbi:keratin, type I cytoskeletal 10-like [Impatiens glandulifera]|uniref:keratin, type I cytoskeletal 10-like n=1 Tax=Impatiens glandulifera TaxID=253017 RepID=UPI001FB0F2EF|nr:keratin, type I cytoskeletal 10-like [Impatiens glandulifera]
MEEAGGNEKKVLKWARTSEVAEALKRKDLVEACLYGKSLFSIFEARKANFNPAEKGSEVEMKVLKKLNDILDSYVSVASRHIHGADCSGAEPLNDDEAMDTIDAENDTDELDAIAKEEIEEEEHDEAAKKAESEEISSHEESSAEGNKVLISLRSMLSSIQKTMTKAMNTKEEEREGFCKIIKVLTELDNTLKKNTYETHVANLNFSKFEKQLFSSQSELLDIERSKRAPSTDDNPRPTKRGGGRSGGERGGRNSGGRSRLANVDQGGRGSDNERGGRSSGGGRGGRGYPSFFNMLPDQDMSPTDPRVKREEQ